MNNKLALSDDILMTIEKPGRYVGNEFNAVIKDSKADLIRFAMCFPDVYEIGMSHLGIQILYDMFNKREDVYCERVYSPWPDLHKIMKERNIPLFALESQDAIKDFDFIGMTLQYEMCYTNILQIIDLAQLELRSEDRKNDDPIVIVGGPCCYNPEPYAPFVDIVYMGEGEIVYDELFDLYKKEKASGTYSKCDFLRKAAKIPGLYVPAFYEVTYKEDGTIASFGPIYDDLPKTIVRQVVEDMDSAPYPTKQLVGFVRPIQDRVVLEIQRGCIRGCRFCQAGMIYRPNREKSVEVLKKQAKELISNSGHEEISLSSLSSSDYHDLNSLMDFLIDECLSEGINVSLPSLRIDAFSLDVMSKVQDVRKSSLTFAPEAGSQRMRNVINKGLTEEDILGGAALAFKGGWNKVKLYFMLGLPSETEDDIKAIPELANKICATYYEIPKDQRNGKCQVTMSTSFFVPKPFTPFQWEPMCTPEQFLERSYLVGQTMRAQLNQKSIKYNWHDSDVTVLEGLLARGDRKVADVIEEVYKQGGFFDAWNDYFSFDRWKEAMAKFDVTFDFYCYRRRELDEILPWDFVDVLVTKEFLIRELKNSQNESVTPNCKMRCNGCGLKSLNTGVCNEGKI